MDVSPNYLTSLLGNLSLPLHLASWIPSPEVTCSLKGVFSRKAKHTKKPSKHRELSCF
ncbi:MAG: hypothetical protein ACI9ON_001285 [Limisphaerales bacterium]|jgi:hypothetical protein